VPFSHHRRAKISLPIGLGKWGPLNSITLLLNASSHQMNLSSLYAVNQHQ
jgi:hypothetical protein